MKVNITVIKEIFIFVAGATIGSLVTRYFVKKKAMAMLDSEIEKTREYFLNAQKEGVLIEEKYTESKDSFEMYRGSVVDSKEEAIDYTRYYTKREIPAEDPAENESPSEDKGEELVNDRIISEQMTREANERDGIEIISKDSFDIDLPQFEKLELTYWATDEILSDDEEHIIEDLDQVVGSTLYDAGLVEYGDVGEIYIRNYDLGCDYHVTKLYASYRDSVIS